MYHWLCGIGVFCRYLEISLYFFVFTIFFNASKQSFSWLETNAKYLWCLQTSLCFSSLYDKEPIFPLGCLTFKYFLPFLEAVDNSSRLVFTNVIKWNLPKHISARFLPNNIYYLLQLPACIVQAYLIASGGR